MSGVEPLTDEEIETFRGEFQWSTFSNWGKDIHCSMARIFATIAERDARIEALTKQQNSLRVDLQRAYDSRDEQVLFTQKLLTERALIPHRGKKMANEKQIEILETFGLEMAMGGWRDSDSLPSLYERVLEQLEQAATEQTTARKQPDEHDK